ncbi:MAG: PqqD family protein [Clostridiales bacterium]|nr:PqqD family protein [Clostridiales bacterium]MCR5275231.1 PqqD family protein [Clostridiales bacterium]
MKLSPNFLIHTQEDDGEYLLIPVADADFSGVVRGNRTFGAILNLLKEDTTEEEIISSMQEKFDAPREVIEGDVTRALSELKKINAIVE